MRILKTILVLFLIQNTFAQVQEMKWRDVIYKSDKSWFATDEAKKIAENVLLYQREIGGWPKNIQMHHPLSESEIKNLNELKTSTKDCTTDNGATIQEMKFLSEMFAQNPDERYQKAFLKGLDYLLEAQYDNGGWPQFYPLKKGYYTHITYNDDSMVNILKLIQEIKNETNFYSITPKDEILNQCKVAFDKGIDCILKTQYFQNGKLTGWCAQHDEITLLPAKARAYELPSLSGGESANIVLLLMSIENPTIQIIEAIDAAVNWFEKTKITGKKEERILDDQGKMVEKKIVDDPTAKPLWGRFMALEDNKVFFCDRDGVVKYSMEEISLERRIGYGWYRTEPRKVLDLYPEWKKKAVSGLKSKTKTPKNEHFIVVCKEGSGDYTTIQEAINNAQSYPYERIVIFIKNGIYHEKVKVHEWNTNLVLVGESKEKTIITYNDYFNKIGLGRNSTFYTYTLLVEANNFTALNLTIENSSGDVGQAVALSIFADEAIIKNCNILGNQDTLYASGKGNQLYENCYIEGTTDFIFGSATAVFKNCTIHSKKNSYITAASTPERASFGYVFMNCQLTSKVEVEEVYLGRPWRIYAKTVFINCALGSHILPEGWHNWNKKEAEKTVLYGEYKNKGAGFQPEKRVNWSHQLSKREAKKYTLENIFGKSQSKWFDTNIEIDFENKQLKNKPLR